MQRQEQPAGAAAGAAAGHISSASPRYTGELAHSFARTSRTTRTATAAAATAAAGAT